MQGAPNIFDCFRFLDIQKQQLVAGYDILRDSRQSHAGRHVVLVGMLIALGSIGEGTEAACRLNPTLRSVQSRFQSDLNDWRRMRHDAAHVFDRVFFPQRKGANVPWTASGLRVAAYDPATDEVSTGSEPGGAITLWAAIEKVFQLSSSLEFKHHGEAASLYDRYVRPVGEQIGAVQAEIRAETGGAQEQH
jgi:hypothetical protein